MGSSNDLENGRLSQRLSLLEYLDFELLRYVCHSRLGFMGKSRQMLFRFVNGSLKIVSNSFSMPQRTVKDYQEHHRL